MIEEINNVKKFVQFLNESHLDKNVKQFTSNILEIETSVTDDKIEKYINKYPNKWVLYDKELGFIWIKDKPKLFYGQLPEKVYHVSNNPNLDKIGIKTSSETTTPFGYYDFTFFYLSLDDVDYGSILYEKGKNYLYETDTNIPNINWYEGFNEPIDGEENITTNSFISPNYIKKIIL